MKSRLEAFLPALFQNTTMTPKLHISTDLTLPIEAVTQTFGILAKRGAGKSYTASVMAEEMLKAGQPIVAIDPTGAWWGLRSVYPIVVLGGEHSDVPLEESAGEVIARAIVDNRFPAVVDLSLFRKGQVIRFMVAFAETLYRLNREPLHLFVDEADAVAPQGRTFGGDENRMLGAMEDIVRRGRKRGIGCTLITQRPAVLNKNVLTQCESLFALRLTHPRDIGAIREWIDVHADPAQAALLESELPSLPIGTAWFWSPGWLGVMKKVAIRKRDTFDSSATPKPGESPRQPKSLAQIDVASLGEQIKATVAKAKADDPKELRKRIADLERQVKAKPAVAVDQAVVDRAVASAVSARDREWQTAIRERESIIGDFKKRLTRIGELAHVNGEAAIKAPIPPGNNLRTPTKAVVTTPVASAKEKRAVIHAGNYSLDTSLGKAERAILTAAYWLRDESPTKAKLAFYADYSSKSSGVDKALSNLRSAGLITGTQITGDGIAAVGNVPDKPRGQELREWLRRHLGQAENAILDALIAAHPKRMTKEAVAEASGYSDRSSGVDKALSNLRTIEAAQGGERDGGTRAADVFFE